MSPQREYFIGVDGGGSKTVALVAAIEGDILGRGESGSSNYHAVGIERAGEALDKALRAAFAAAGKALDPQRVCMANFGLAGVYRADDEAALHALAAQKWPGMPVSFTHDARLVLAAGTPQDWGIGIICGTGSIVYGRSIAGESTRAGGWGYLLGDEGSGYDIGLTALRRVARAADGRGPQTVLTELILNTWKLDRAQDLIGYVYRPQVAKADIAALSVVVEQAALAGDAVALEILRAAGGELARAARVVAERLEFSGPVPCALVGGVIVKGTVLAQALLRAASADNLELSPVLRVTEPAMGAIRLARESAGPASV